MIISKKTKHTQKLVKVPAVRVHKCGHFVFNKASVELLEIDNPTEEGVVFGYDNHSVFVAYSKEVDAYRGSYKNGESSFRFASKYEADNIMSAYGLSDKIAVLEVSDKPEDVVILDGYKFFKLKRLVV